MNHEDPEDHGGHETDPFSKKTYSMRLPSPLSAEAERAMTATIVCAVAVHRALGPGFIESIYRRAMCIELAAKGVRQ